VVGQAGDHGLDDAVVAIRDDLGAVEGDQHHRAEHEQRRQDPDREELPRPDHQRRRQAGRDEAQVEEHAEAADQGDLDGGRGEGQRRRERHHLAAARVAVPDRHGLAVVRDARVGGAHSDVAHQASR
jgi:hypothetical protein